MVADLVMADGAEDRLASFAPAILGLRWGTTSVSLALSIISFVTSDWLAVACVGALIANTIIRTRTPLRDDGQSHALMKICAEAATVTAMTIATGRWDSPLVFSLLAVVVVSGFSRGFGVALRLSAAVAIPITIADVIVRGPDSLRDPRFAIQWTVFLLMMALIAGYARRISGEATRRHSQALDRLHRLSDANALLYSLHRVAQTLPASLDMSDVLDSTLTRLRGLFDFNFVHVLLFDDTDARWQVLRREGCAGADRFGPTDLPAPLKRAIAQNRLIDVRDLSGRQGPGMTAMSGSGLYTVLMARGSLIGLLAVEHRDSGHYGQRDIELLNGFVEPVALAIDNARWFGRLRTVGADEERTRIARDLHDRIGQSLAYLGFELDRIISRDRKGEEVSDQLADLRSDIRSTVGEVRDTLYDLRTDVSDDRDFGGVLREFGERLEARAELSIVIEADVGGERLPILQERELWRIAQEALVNVERHAEATTAIVRWRSDGVNALLEIEDDGQGFDASSGRVDSYGVMGMRERASSIGAAFDVTSAPGEGTKVRCVLASAAVAASRDRSRKNLTH